MCSDELLGGAIRGLVEFRVQLVESRLCGMTQKALTACSDTTSWNQHLTVSEQGARAWLAAVPVARTRLEGAAFFTHSQNK